MRRPVQLPVAPEPQETPPARFPRRRGSDVRGPAAGTASDAADDADPTLARDAAAVAGALPAGDAAAETLSPRDVWRAARARRRTLRAEIRRFTQRSRRRRWAWLGGLAAVLVVVGGSAAAAYSPLFAVEEVTVVGASALDPAAVAQALEGQQGVPLALVDPGAVKAALVAFPLIESYSLEARPPHELRVRIVERTAVGVVESAAGFTLVDAAGVALATTPTRPEGQPVLEVTGGVESSAFRSVGRVVRSLPAEVRGAVVGVRATTLDDVTLTLGDGLTVVWGSAEDSALKGVVLSAALVANPGARSIDVSSAEVVVAG